ncbi:MAG: tRNA (cmo5U34)-methyltransferase [Saprospiraceae bacterium]|jgi:tRNA (cmo5U34)-methyltransferase
MKTEKNIALEFNDFSKNYTHDMIGCVPHYLQLLSSFVSHLPDSFTPRSILDLGSGNGNVTAQLIPRFPVATFTLVDASEEMIDLCRTQFKDYDIIYENKYFEDFSFKEKSYDMVVAGFSLHHCDTSEKQAIFKNIYKSLKKGGLFSYSDLMISKTNRDHEDVLKKWKEFVHTTFPDGEKWNWVMEHYKEFDKPTDFQLQKEWLLQSGFSTVETPFRKGYWMYVQAVK